MSTLKTIRRGIGALLLVGAAGGLISLAASGVAAAAPATPHNPVISPGDPVITRYLDRSNWVELNPQPLPPREWAPGNDRALNPQPLPPGPPDPDFSVLAGLVGGF